MDIKWHKKCQLNWLQNYRKFEYVTKLIRSYFSQMVLMFVSVGTINEREV